MRRERLAADRPTDVLDRPGGRIEYRWEPHGDRTVLVFHGGHMRAGLALGEDDFADANFSVLAPSRPGYGRTSLTGFVDHLDDVAALCDRLGIDRITAVTGISAGGPTAVGFTARHPGLAERLLLLSAVGPLPYPDPWTRAGARLIFAPAVEGATWSAVRAGLRTTPDLTLARLVGALTTKPGRAVVDALTPDDRRAVIDLFSRMRSGHGFVNDLRPAPDLSADVNRPTLVVATRHDHGVPFAHAEALTARIPQSRLLESTADSHLIWYAPDWPAIASRILAFLVT